MSDCDLINLKQYLKKERKKQEEKNEIIIIKTCYLPQKKKEN